MKKQLKMMVDEFLLWQVDRLRPAFGPSRSEVVTFILQSWLTEHGTKALEHVDRVKARMTSRDVSK